MKSLFLPVAILATLASCSTNETVEEIIDQKNPIEFATLNDKVTRAPSGTAGLGYTVYAQYTTPVATATGWYVNGLAVGSNDSATDAPFWPENELTFYAYAGTDVALTNVEPAVTPAVGTLSATYTVTAAAAEDFTVAIPVKQTYSVDNASVSLTFNHMLSKVMVSASLAKTMVDAGYKLDFTGVKTTLEVVNNKGTVDIITTPLTITPKPGAASYEKNNKDEEMTSVAKSTAVEYLIMPQAADDYCTVTMTGVKLTHATNKPIDVTLTKVFSTSGSQAFAQGTQYNLNFEVSLAKITFSSETAVWGDATEVPVN